MKKITGLAILFTFVAIFLAVFAVGASVHAADSTTIDLGTLNPFSCGDLGCVWDALFALAVGLAVAATTIMTIWGGFQILTAGGDPEKVKTGGKTVLYAAIGLMLVLVSGSVVYLVKNIVGG